MPGKPWNPDEDWTAQEHWQDQYHRPAKEDFDPLAYLGQLVPSHALWLVKLPDDIRRGHVKYARELLKGLTAAEIEAAVADIDRFDAMPKMDFLPSVVARRAKAKRASRLKHKMDVATNSDTVACIFCKDTGFVSIYEPHVVEAYRNGAVPQRAGGSLVEYECVALCVCSAGAKLKNAGYKYIGTYRPSKDVRLVYGELEKDIDFFDGVTGAPPVPKIETLSDAQQYIAALAQSKVPPLK